MGFTWRDHLLSHQALNRRHSIGLILSLSRSAGRPIFSIILCFINPFAKTMFTRDLRDKGAFFKHDELESSLYHPFMVCFGYIDNEDVIEWMLYKSSLATNTDKTRYHKRQCNYLKPLWASVRIQDRNRTPREVLDERPFILSSRRNLTL